MKILALNCGSASVKFRLFETSAELAQTGADRSLAGGIIENSTDCEAAVKTAISSLGGDSREIAAVGHRIVHGGDRFRESVVLDDDTAREIERFNDLAPLHNPLNMAGYRTARTALPHCRQIGVFDTAFHHTIPAQAFLYALPYELYTRSNVRRYGFHGTSHHYMAMRFAQLRGGRPEDFKLITCHLGNGCSIAAIDGGRSVDTSMGFTPLEGLVMGTRPGDVDAGAVLHWMEKENLNPAQVRSLLNKRSGLAGISGLTNDMRCLIEASLRGHERARLAIDMFCYKIRKYIGAYLAVLGGADAIVFTGGIGENAPLVRAQVCEPLAPLGIAIDGANNEGARGIEANISAVGSRSEVWVIPTCEELLIAREALRCVERPTRLRPEPQ